jgi:hypothetical protein
LASIIINGEEILLHRHFHAEILIYSAEDRPHTTMAQGLDDPVAFTKELTLI